MLACVHLHTMNLHLISKQQTATLVFWSNTGTAGRQETLKTAIKEHPLKHYYVKPKSKVSSLLGRSIPKNIFSSLLMLVTYFPVKKTDLQPQFFQFWYLQLGIVPPFFQIQTGISQSTNRNIISDFLPLKYRVREQICTLDTAQD